MLGWVEKTSNDDENDEYDLCDFKEYEYREIDAKIEWNKSTRGESNMPNIIKLEKEMMKYYALYNKL